MGVNSNANISGNRQYMEQQQLRQDTQSSFVSAVASFGNALSAAGLAKGETLSMASGGLQLEQVSRNYRDARIKQTGGVYTAAAANGVRVTGSVAESLTQSLTQLGLEEANRKYDIKTRMIEAERDRKFAKAAQAGSLLSAFGNLVGSAASVASMAGSGGGDAGGGAGLEVGKAGGIGGMVGGIGGIGGMR